MTDEDMNPENAERPRGILSKNERRYYTGDLDADSQKERNIRAGAREHLKHSLLDLVVIENRMQDRDLEMVLKRDEFSMSKRGIDRLHPSLDSAMKAAISIMYFYYDKPEPLAGAIDAGISMRETKNGYNVDVNTDINIETRSELEFLERLLRNHGPEELSFSDLGALHDAGRISTEEHIGYLSEKSEDE